MSAGGTQTELVVEDFETEVSREDEDRVIETIAECIQRLREQIDDDILDEVFTTEPPGYTMRADFTRDQLDPEPVTKNRVIEPLLAVLGYEEYGYEAGGYSDEIGEKADYAISLRDVESVDSSRLLIEAEPINKPLRNRGHGLDQVQSWLNQREFESDFGFATDGVRWIFNRYDADAYSHNIIEEIDLQPVFFTLFENETTAEAPPTSVVSDEERGLISRLIRTFAYDNFISIISNASEVIKQREEEITDEFYDDYIRIVFGVEDDTDERRARSLVGDGIVPPDDATGDDVRLFAVELMNRLVFIKFLEDKRIVRPDLLETITATYEDRAYAQTLYKSFLDPLFYEVLNVKPEKRSSEVESVDFYSDIPYLNGGLFRPELNGTSGVDERDFDVKNSVLMSIIDLFESYRFSADGGPTDIDPSVLGSVFEKTINYLTTDPADQNSDLGAYYTPSEITRFCAEQTVRPALKERFGRVLIEERDWPETEVEQYDTLYELIDGIPGSGDLVTELLSTLDDFHVVDPGMGSGHFLTSAIEEIVNIRQALYARQEAHPSRHRMKKTTVQNNIYGVDIMAPAVEIGKLRLWLSIIAELREEDLEKLDTEEIALPNVTFNVRQGNSLVGYIGFPEETEDGMATFERWTEDSVRSRYENVIEQIQLYEEHSSFPEKAEEHRRRANKLLEDYREELNTDIVDEFQEVADGVNKDDIVGLSPFHWVLEFAEVYAEGGFDVIIGNPPWNRIKPNRDDFFSRYEPTFTGLRGGEKDRMEEELLEEEHISEAFSAYKREIKIQSEYFKEGGAYTMQSANIDGQTQSSERDLSALFFERIFDLSKDDGYVSQVLPGRIFHGAPTKALRERLLDHTSVSSLISFENRGIFDDIDTRYNFGVLTFKNQGQTETIPGIFQHSDLAILDDREGWIDIPRQVLTDFSPSSLLFPRIQSKEDLEVLRVAVTYSSIGDTERSWYAHPTRPLDKSGDSERFFDEPEGCDYPILTGRNFYSFSHNNRFVEDLEPPFQWSVDEERNPDRSAKLRIREKKLNNLKRQIFEEFDGTGTMKGFVNDLLERKRGEKLSTDDVLLPSTTYRVGFRRIARGTDERSLISAVVPPGPVCDYSFYVIEPFEIHPIEEHLSQSPPPLHDVYEPIFTNRELFVALGLMNSIPFDFMIRRKIDNSIPIYSFKETQVPDLTHGNEWFEHIWTRAAQLNCYGEEFEEMRDDLEIDAVTNPDEREEVQVELDAGAFHAYGLDREQTAFVLDDFHRVQNPRRMTEAYFEKVLDKYDELA